METTAAAVLDELHAAGFTLRGEGERLIVAPLSLLPPGLRAKLVGHKKELLALFRYGTVTADAGDVASWSDPALIDGRAYQGAWGRLAEADRRRAAEVRAVAVERRERDDVRAAKASEAKQGGLFTGGGS
jgi:hypothetical protein